MHGPERAWTYWVVLVGLIGALIALPFITVDVSVRAPGMVRPRIERAELQTTISGRIADVLAHDNDSVTAGQALLILSTGELDEQLRRHGAMESERAAAVADLHLLLEDETGAKNFQTNAWRLEHAQFRAQVDSYRLAETKAGVELARYLILTAKGIATQLDLDNARYESDRLHAESLLLSDQARARWAARLREEQSALDALISTDRRLEEEKTQYTVRAPVAGVLVGFNGWSSGSQVRAGQNLGMVSPVDLLRVESQLSSRDIGLVRIGQCVRMQIDAYPYTQWGMLDGVVETIGGDLLGGPTASGAPGYFKVLIRPAATYLALHNGGRGELKNGLTLTARYLVARRSLLQILYEDADRFLNPQEG